MLGDIAKWLKESYENNTKLNGIIYIHSIDNVHMEGSALRNLKMFRELCGTEPLKNVILATSFWGKVDKGTGERREEELKTTPEFWGGMIRKGSRTARFTDRASALSIISSLVNRRAAALSIQHELVEERKPLVETNAGIVVNEELARLEAKHKKEKEEIQKEMQDALRERDIELQEILELQRKKLDDELDKVHRQQEQLRAERRAHQRRLEIEYGDRIKNLEHQMTDRRGGGFSEYRGGPSEYQTMREVDFDVIVSRMRANESKIKPEERVMVELKIQEAAKESRSKQNGKKVGKFLLQSLRVALPVTTMALLGFPLHLPGGLFNSSNEQDTGTSAG